MGEFMAQHSIEAELKRALCEAVQTQPAYPGYPTERLTAKHPLVAKQLEQGFVTELPEGPWNAGTNKLQSSLTQDEVRLLQLEGYSFDTYSRPLHPWLRDMLQNEAVGVVTGTGAYWNMGPNKTADPIILSNEDIPKVFLVKRKDNGLWAFAGGFIDPGESASKAAQREAFEEGGIITGEPEHTLYSGVVADTRTTAYAWAETTAFIFRVTGCPQPKIDPAEVEDAQWWPLTMPPQQMHGSHGILLKEVQKYELARNPNFFA